MQHPGATVAHPESVALPKGTPIPAPSNGRKRQKPSSTWLPTPYTLLKGASKVLGWFSGKPEGAMRNKFGVTRVTLGSKQEWGVVATEDLAAGSFLGFYTGTVVNNSDCSKDSLYSLKWNRELCIVPFRDEKNITEEMQQAHPLAMLNEPAGDNRANCHMVVQDFRLKEVSDPDENAKFYRGMGIFTCCAIRAGQELTWHYGKDYESARKGYTPGSPCTEEQVGLVQENSWSVLEALSSKKVPAHWLYPVFSNVASERNDLLKKRRRRRRSPFVGQDVSTSGSGSDSESKPQQSRFVRRSRGANLG